MKIRKKNVYLSKDTGSRNAIFIYRRITQADITEAECKIIFIKRTQSECG